MEQNPSSEPNSHSASQEIPLLLWNPKVPCYVHRGPPVIPVVSHVNPVHTFPPYFPMILSYIILPSMPRSSEWSNQNVLCIFYLSPCVLHVLPAHPP